MPATTPTSLLELQTEVWKSRAQAKQKWLERTLAEPAKTSREGQRQLSWIAQALEAVKRGQDELKFQTALLDVYAEHLNALEMSLMAAAEKRASADVSARKD
jgi:paraquat-inducible protein B